MDCCDECEETSNDCLENCGCPIEITSLACIRHAGSEMPCIEVVKGDTLEAIVQKINDKICDLSTGVDGDDGEPGQGIDHVSFTGEPGTDGQPGQTSTYTMWGDAAETINLGTFVVYNGVDGTGIDHVSFTSTDGTNPAAGSPGQTDTYTMWEDALETQSLGTFVVYNGNNGIDGYDSGWVTINDFNTTYNFGLPEFTSGWTHPKIRVVGKTVFLEGFLMLPLSTDSITGIILAPNVSNYSSTHKIDAHIYTGTSGGYNVLSTGIMVTHNPIVPQNLAPSENHLISHFEMSYRPINDAGDKYALNLTSIFSETRINTDGTLEIKTLSDTNDDALAGTIIPNSPFHQVVSRINRDALAPSYVSFYTEYNGSTVDQRESPISAAQYPLTFDGRRSKDLGGFRVKLTTSYPLGQNITQTQIEQAIAQIQE